MSICLKLSNVTRPMGISEDFRKTIALWIDQSWTIRIFFPANDHRVFEKAPPHGSFAFYLVRGISVSPLEKKGQKTFITVQTALRLHSSWSLQQNIVRYFRSRKARVFCSFFPLSPFVNKPKLKGMCLWQHCRFKSYIGEILSKFPPEQNVKFFSGFVMSWLAEVKISNAVSSCAKIHHTKSQ